MAGLYQVDVRERIAHVLNARNAGAEQIGNVRAGIAQRAGAKRDPRETDEQEGQQVCERARQSQPPTAVARGALDGESRAVQAAPQHELPRRPVPQAAEQHDDQQVRIRA